MTIITQAVDKTEVFQNDGGGVTIKQTDSFGEEHLVSFPAIFIRAVIEALELVKLEIDSEIES